MIRCGFRFASLNNHQLPRLAEMRFSRAKKQGVPLCHASAGFPRSVRRVDHFAILDRLEVVQNGS